jgi:hypothetical protein
MNNAAHPFHARCEELAKAEIERIRIKARNWPGAHKRPARQTTQHPNCRSLPVPMQLSFRTAGRILAEDFTVHTGGPRPLPAGVAVLVLTRSGYSFNVVSSNIDWRHIGDTSDIVGWKHNKKM